MPRKNSPGPNEPTRKKVVAGSVSNTGELKQGQRILDNTGKRWKLGKAIGIGGFGEIYDVMDPSLGKESKKNTSYVAKIEKHTNGPLFVEINCYLRLGKQDMIEKWKKESKLQFLGVPYFVASGSHISHDEKYRFLIMPKYDKDLEAIFQSKRVFNLKTVLVIASRIIDTLEYIHFHGYVHADIKASNIMLGYNQNGKKSSSHSLPKKQSPLRNLRRGRPLARTCGRSLRPIATQNYVDDIPYLDDVLNEYNRKNKNVSTKNKASLRRTPSDDSINSIDTNTFEGDSVYLLDYGLATKYLLSNGEHREFCSDQRRAHAGTVLFCSRDAHKGIPSRRSDLESLAYNMIYWLTGSLPWIDDVHEPEEVEKKKNRGFTDVKTFLQICFEDCPTFMIEMFNYLSKLQFKDAPNYNFFRVLFRKTIKDYGYKDDSKLDFDNLEGWGRKQKKIGKTKVNKKENKTVFKRPSLLLYSPRIPLSSNIIFKRPKLRKKIKDKLAKNSMMNWSKILIMDPESLIKQAHRKNTDCDDRFNIFELDLESLNPTPAMRDVYNRASEREGSSPYQSRGDELSTLENIEGYTPEMMRVFKRMRDQKEMEFERIVHNNMPTKKRGRKRIKRSESPRTTSKHLRSDATSLVKDLHPLRKVRSNPLKRTYSLRG